MSRDRASLAEGERLLFWCPGCDEAHAISYGAGAWSWNGDLVNVTITPSVLVTGVQWGADQPFRSRAHAAVPDGGATSCHSFVTGGRIAFLSDCTHALANQTVDLPAWPSAE